LTKIFEGAESTVGRGKGGRVAERLLGETLEIQIDGGNEAKRKLFFSFG